jgi:hypothetical protein
VGQPNQDFQEGDEEDLYNDIVPGLAQVDGVSALAQVAVLHSLPLTRPGTGRGRASVHTLPGASWTADLETFGEGFCIRSMWKRVGICKLMGDRLVFAIS